MYLFITDPKTLGNHVFDFKQRICLQTCLHIDLSMYCSCFVFAFILMCFMHPKQTKIDGFSIWMYAINPETCGLVLVINQWYQSLTGSSLVRYPNQIFRRSVHRHTVVFMVLASMMVSLFFYFTLAFVVLKRSLAFSAFCVCLHLPVCSLILTSFS